MTLQTANDSEAVTVRARNVTASGFESALFEEEALMDGHPVETIGYLAIHSPAGSGRISLKGGAQPYLLQTITADHNWTAVVSQPVQLEEEKSRDDEILHTDETLHVLALGPHLFAQDVSSHGFDTAALRRRPPEHTAPVEWGVVNGIDHEWTRLPFAKSYTKPVLIVKPVSSNGADPGVIRLNGVEPTSAQLRYQEWDYLDGIHFAKEQVFYLVAEQGQSTLAGLTVEAGTVDTDALGRFGQWESIVFNGGFDAAPAPFGSVQTYNGTEAVTTRLRDVDADGLQLTMDEQESKDNGHVEETVGWIAIETGAGDTSEGRHISVRTELNFLDDAGQTLLYHPLAPLRYPVWVSDVSSTLGGDPVFIRYRTLTAGSIDLYLQEETSADAETGHVQEDISVFVGE